MRRQVDRFNGAGSIYAKAASPGNGRKRALGDSTNLIEEQKQGRKQSKPPEVEISGMKVPELKELCQKRGLSDKGKKAELIARLQEV